MPSVIRFKYYPNTKDHSGFFHNDIAMWQIGKVNVYIFLSLQSSCHESIIKSAHMQLKRLPSVSFLKDLSTSKNVQTTWSWGDALLNIKVNLLRQIHIKENTEDFMRFHWQGHEAGDPSQWRETCLPEGQAQPLFLYFAEPRTLPQDAHLVF